jgi:osmotically-inducible protein OsmY
MANRHRWRERENWARDDRDDWRAHDYDRAFGGRRDEYYPGDYSTDLERGSDYDRGRDFGRGYGSGGFKPGYRGGDDDWGQYGSSDGDRFYGAYRQGADWGRAYGGGDYSGGRGSDWNYDSRTRDYGGWDRRTPGKVFGRSSYGRNYGGGERGFWDRASDEVSSWFGDDQAEQRRRMDHYRGRGPKGYTRSDDRIREDVSDRLTEDPHIDASDVEVSVNSGGVTLTGAVISRFAKRHAEDIAESVSGVRHVQNNIRISERTGSSGEQYVGPFADAARAVAEGGKTSRTR